MKLGWATKLIPAAVVAAGAFIGDARAQSATDFYRGVKEFNVYIGSTTGGGPKTKRFTRS